MIEIEVDEECSCEMVGQVIIERIKNRNEFKA